MINEKNKKGFFARLRHSIYCRLHALFVYRLFHRKTVVLFEHREIRTVESPVTIRRVDDSMLNDILHFQDQRYVEIFRKFLDKGELGYFGYLDGKCVHRTWVKQGPEKVSLHHFWTLTLTENEMFIHYCETAAEARGKSIYPYVLSKITSEYSKSHRIFISTDGDNFQSIRGIEKAGFREIARKELIGFLGFKIIRSLPLSPATPVSGKP